jgi:hypothetical protein
MLRLRAMFIRHWFVGVYVILLAIWIPTLITFAAGAHGITFGNPYGKAATIDFGNGDLEEFVIINVAFVALGLLWLVVGGPIAFFARRRRVEAARQDRHIG